MGVYNKFIEYRNRQTTRLRGYDYTRPGYYFVTACIHNREQRLFGDVINGRIVLNEAGRWAEQCWLAIPKHFPHVELDEYVIMPNHVHGILCIPVGVNKQSNPPVGTNDYSPRRINGTTKTIGSVIRGFKIGVTGWFRRKGIWSKIWQRNYYDHIIRNKESLFSIRNYIHNNPMNWAGDHQNHRGE